MSLAVPDLPEEHEDDTPQDEPSAGEGQSQLGDSDPFAVTQTHSPRGLFQGGLPGLLPDTFVNPPPRESSATIPSGPEPSKGSPVEEREGNLVGRWRLERLLGRGGMGAVFEATACDDSGQRSAVKVMFADQPDEADFLARFDREARAMRMVEHENVIRCLDSDVSESAEPPFIALELVEGEDLQARLHREKRLPVPEALALGRRILEGLAAAHRVGVIHRDLKPSNILLGKDGSLKLADFGLARREAETLVLTATGTVLGTPNYMSTEQVFGEPTGPCSDVYSFAALFFHLVAGRPPFMSENVLKVMWQHGHDERPRLDEFVDGMPRGLSELIEQCMSIDSAKRPADAGAVLAALDAIEEETSQDGEDSEAMWQIAFVEVQPGDQLGRFLVGAQIGRGGMGIVFAATHPDHGEVAIKVLPAVEAPDTTAFKRFEREARTASLVECPEVVRVLEHGQETLRGESVSFMAMELIKGRSLYQRLEQDGPVPEAEALVLMAGVARGLAAAHAKGIIHRDLKPSNVLGADGGQPKIADFGLARLYEVTSSLTQGGILGTPSYMSPEQGEGKAVRPATDIYSLGATFYHVTTGARVFSAEQPAQIVFQHCHRFPTPARQRNHELSEAFSLVLQKCLLKRPEDRYGSAVDLLADLKLVGQRTFPLTERRREARREERRFTRRLSLLVALPSIALLLILAAVFVVGGDQRRSERISRATGLLQRLERAVEADETAADDLLIQAVGALEDLRREHPDAAEIEDLKSRLDVSDARRRLMRERAAKSEAAALLVVLEGRLEPGAAVPEDDELRVAQRRLAGIAYLLKADRDGFDKSLERVGEVVLLLRQLAGHEALDLDSVKDWNVLTKQRLDLLVDLVAAGRGGVWKQRAQDLVSDVERRIGALQRDLDVELNAQGGPNQLLRDDRPGEALEALEKIGARLPLLSRVPELRAKLDLRISQAELARDALPKAVREARTFWERHPKEFDQAEQGFQAVLDDPGFEVWHGLVRDLLSEVRAAREAGADAELAPLLHELSLLRESIGPDAIPLPAYYQECLDLLARFPDHLLATKAGRGVEDFRRQLDEDRRDRVAAGLMTARKVLDSRDLGAAKPLIASVLAHRDLEEAFGVVVLKQRLEVLLELRGAMVEVPAGEYVVGADDIPLARPKRRVTLESFWIDRHETRNAHYHEFLAEIVAAGPDHARLGYCAEGEAPGKDHTPAFCEDERFNQDNQPVVGVDWFDAAAFATWAGKRLPSEEEWEAAARGPEGRRFPWGGQYDPDLAVRAADRASEVGSLPGGASFCGAQDMAGNVWEWCEDWFDVYSGGAAHPSHGEQVRVIRGGSFDEAFEDNLQSAQRYFKKPTDQRSFIGFRCVRSEP